MQGGINATLFGKEEILEFIFRGNNVMSKSKDSATIAIKGFIHMKMHLLLMRIIAHMILM